MCEGLVAAELLPSPKSHAREATVPSDWSWNTTVSGATPLVGAAVRAATGGTARLCLPTRLNRLVLTVLTLGPPTFGPLIRNRLLPVGLPVIVWSSAGSPKKLSGRSNS